MKVLHLSSVYAPHRVGGAEKIVELLAEGLARRGHEAAVAHLGPAPAPSRVERGVAVHPLPHRNPLWIEDTGRHPLLRQANKVATLLNVLTTRDIARVIDRMRPDVVHTHSMVELSPWVWPLAASRGCRVVHTLHDYDLLCIRAALFKDGRLCAQRHTACKAFSAVKMGRHHHIDHVVGVSRAILDKHVEFGGFAALPSSHRHVVWNAVPQPPAPTPRPRREGGPVILGFIGRLVPEKGLETLLEACRRLPAEGFRLRIAGRPGPTQPDLLRRAEGLPVEWLGYAEPGAFLASIDTLVVPSIWHEPFGLTVVEAYAAGVPVIGSDCGGIAEIVGAVDPTALVPAGDAPALAARLQSVLAQGPQPVPEAARQQLLARTDAAHMVAAYEGVYEAALASGRRGRF